MFYDNVTYFTAQHAPPTITYGHDAMDPCHLPYWGVEAESDGATGGVFTPMAMHNTARLRRRLLVLHHAMDPW